VRLAGREDPIPPEVIHAGGAKLRLRDILAEIKFPQGEVVERFEIYADTDDDEAGSYTKVHAYFNEAAVQLEEIVP
jgi:hypothetical protein